jgi:hypothetical protein
MWGLSLTIICGVAFLIMVLSGFTARGVTLSVWMDFRVRGALFLRRAALGKRAERFLQ